MNLMLLLVGRGLHHLLRSRRPLLLVVHLLLLRRHLVLIGDHLGLVLLLHRRGGVKRVGGRLRSRSVGVEPVLGVGAAGARGGGEGGGAALDAHACYCAGVVVGDLEREGLGLAALPGHCGLVVVLRMMLHGGLLGGWVWARVHRCHARVVLLCYVVGVLRNAGWGALLELHLLLLLLLCVVLVVGVHLYVVRG